MIYFWIVVSGILGLALAMAIGVKMSERHYFRSLRRLEEDNLHLQDEVQRLRYRLSQKERARKGRGKDYDYEYGSDDDMYMIQEMP